MSDRDPSSHGAARPGDPELDFDVTTTIGTVLVHESPTMLELLVETIGGVGEWDRGNGLQDVRVESLSITAGFGLGEDRRDGAVRQNVDRIHKWGRDHTIVRIVMARNRMTTLIGPGGEVAYLPRS